jgi:hypothetical protein
MADSSKRILTAAEQGSVIAGPTASIRMLLSQGMDVIGVAGKDTKEKIANTRQVIRGMAEQAVSARAQLGSQAHISNSEQALLTQATSGDIDSLTIDEIKILARLNYRLAKQIHKEHELNMQGLPKELEPFKQLYRVSPLPEVGDGWSIKQKP